jgi:transcriptional regulator CtsR
MARLCDDIERFILALLGEGQQVELQRKYLAARFSCAPSQINYVLATRFTPAHGFRVESRRGGGGFVRVIRIDRTRVQYLDAVCRAVGPAVSFSQAAELLSALCGGGVISLAQARLMLSAMGEELIGSDQGAARLRAEMLCSMLLCASKEESQDAM